MTKYISLIFLFMVTAVGSFAQTEKFSAPINWQRYAAAPYEVSILLPKMPVAIYQLPDNCSEIETGNFYAYAGEAVYSLRIIAKKKKKISGFCMESRKFERDNFYARVQDIKNTSGKIQEENLILEEKKVIKIIFKNSTVWLFDDLINNRWYELWINHRENAEVDSKAFIESIKFDKKTEGIKIGEGAERTLGDEEAPVKNSSDENISQKSPVTNDSQPLIIIAKIKPLYTDRARKANVQGIVTLRVTFLANGGIGAITPVSELSHGLTEQAIAAAKKLVFLPQKSAGKPQAIVRPVEFSFRIY